MKCVVNHPKIKEKIMVVNSISYNDKEEVIKITAHEPVDNYTPLKHGWWDFEGDDLKFVTLL